MFQLLAKFSNLRDFPIAKITSFPFQISQVSTQGIIKYGNVLPSI